MLPQLAVALMLALPELDVAIIEAKNQDSSNKVREQASYPCPKQICEQIVL